MKKISRTIKTVEALVSKIEVNKEGFLEQVNYTIIMGGKVTDKQIIKKAKTLYGKDYSYVILSKKTSENKYSCSIDAFIVACMEEAAKEDKQTIIE